MLQLTEEKKKKLNVLQLIAVSFAAVASMFIGSAFGIKGTYAGAGVGTMLSGVIAFLFEKASVRAHDRIRKQQWFLKPDDEDATSMFPAIKVKRSQRPWLLTALAAGVALLSAGAAFGILGIAKAATGTTLGNYSPASRTVSPAVTKTVTDTPTPSFTESEPAFSSAPSSSTPSPSPSKSSTTPSASPSPSPSPDASPLSSNPFGSLTPTGQ